MTIEDGFQKIFDNALSSYSFNVDSAENFLELKDFKDDFCRVLFIDKLISFFAKEYNTDLHSMYIQYLTKCNAKHLERFNQLAANEGLI